jgi:benzodiazapine receptor
VLARYASLAVFLALVVTAVLFAGSFDAGDWYYQKLSRPWWTPPAWFFGAAWSLFYVVAALAAWRVWTSGHIDRARALGWWLMLLVLNVAWSALFFGVNRIGWACLVLGAASLVAALCIRVFGAISKPGGYLMLSLLPWLLFVWTLNMVEWSINGGPLARFLP